MTITFLNYKLIINGQTDRQTDIRNIDLRMGLLSGRMQYNSIFTECLDCKERT